MSVPARFDAMIVDPIPESRMRLRSVISVLGNFGEVHQVSKAADASLKSEGISSLDVYFLSSEIAENDVRLCIEKCRRTKAGRDAAFVLVLKVADQGRSSIAANVLCGADGFLMEPYSVDQLVQITELAAKVKAERRIAREDTAIKMALTEIVPTLDKVATGLSILGQAPRSLARLRASCEILKTLSPEAAVRYYSIAADVFGAARPPFDPSVSGGSSASEALKRRAKEKAIAKAKADELEDEKSL